MKVSKNYVSLLMLFCLLITGCRADPGQSLQQQSVKSTLPANKKPVIVILIDSLMDKPLHDAIQQGRAPALQYLLAHGQYFPKVVSSFPTMSVTVDSSLLTGAYADQHHVPGLVWYSGKEKRMIYYGNGPKEALKINQPQVILDVVYQLNQMQMNKNAKTLYEELEEQGKKSASLNGLVFRGKTEHTLQVPNWIENTTRLPEQIKVTGPTFLSYAAFAQLDPQNNRNARIWKKYGMNDEYSAQELAYLIQQRKIPDVTFTYFPENDMAVHRNGIDHIDGIVNADKALQVALNAFGTWEQAIKNAVWIVMGDTAQSAVQDDRQTATVDLRSRLHRYQIAQLSRPVSNDDQIVIATNERMAYIYALDPKVSLTELVKLLQEEEKLDLIAMKDDQRVYVTAGKSRGSFSYHPRGKLLDEYGQSWTISGDASLADVKITNNRITYGKYPDVLARLYGAMNSHEGRYVVVTVQHGYELIAESSPTHIGGGAHGSLHEKDSLVPMFVVGAQSQPKTLRMVDMKEWLLRLAK